MATTTTTLSMLLVIVMIVLPILESSATNSNFIKSSCSSTTYPAVCVESLSLFAPAIQQSPHELARTALSVSLTSAETTKKFVRRAAKLKGMKRREYEAVKDCLDEMGDTVDRLMKSVGELEHMGSTRGQEFLWHMSNVETWVSAALTDENTCVDGFAGKALDGRLKAAIRSRVINVAQITSNALALVNQFAAGKH